MAKIISLITQKGGAGKTTSTNAIAVCLKHRGYRVLAVDFDPQGYLSFSMGADTADHPTVYDVLKHSAKARQAVQHTEVTDVLPADGLLSNFGLEFTGRGNEKILARELKPLEPLYDYILIDSPPELGLLSTSALVASDVVLVPGLADGYSLRGIIQVHETISRVKEGLNPRLVVGGMFLVRYYPREELSRATWETAQMLTSYLHIPLLETRIRHSSAVAKAMTSLQVDLLDYAPRNNAAKDYVALVDELFAKKVL